MYKFSLFLTGKNELIHLKEILPYYLEYFQDVYYFDVESSDGSYEYAKSFENLNVFRVSNEPYADVLHKKYSHLCKFDWIVYPDPDERWPLDLFHEIILHLDNDNLATISAPCSFFFKNYKLRGTRWGGNKVRGVAFNRSRVNLSDNVHRSKSVKPGFKNHFITSKKCSIAHYWMASYKQLFSKHLRYLNHEGKSRYENGYRTSILRILKTPFLSFVDSFFKKRGFYDRWIGFSLSLFWTWYNTLATIALYRYQKKVRPIH